MSLDDRKQKHVSFDSSSILRSQTVAGNMSQDHSSPSKSSERLLDGRKTPDYVLYSELFTPELARQIVLGNYAKRGPVSRSKVFVFRPTQEVQYADSGNSDRSQEEAPPLPCSSHDAFKAYTSNWQHRQGRHEPESAEEGTEL